MFQHSNLNCHHSAREWTDVGVDTELETAKQGDLSKDMGLEPKNGIGIQE